MHKSQNSSEEKVRISRTNLHYFHVMKIICSSIFSMMCAYTHTNKGKAYGAQKYSIQVDAYLISTCCTIQSSSWA